MGRSTNYKTKVEKILLVVLIIAFIILVSVAIFLNVQKAKNRKERTDILKNYSQRLKNGRSSRNNSTGDVSDLNEAEKDPSKFKSVGILKIDKIEIEYPILDNDNATTLDISIGVTTGKVNEIGNCVIAGHNLRDKTMFGRLKELEIGDTFFITNEEKCIQYKIFRKNVIRPTDFSICNQETNGERWCTLFTCENNGKQRLVVVGKEVK